MLDLSVIILTYNEEIHIKRCLDGISPFIGDVFIIDCFSTDKTLEIARNYDNVTVLQNKWVNYAIRETVDLLDIEFKLTGAAETDGDKNISRQAQAKRMKKHKYVRLPLFWRSFAYFCYRYFFKLGFMEGKEGFLWHSLQGWWYRTLVDAKVYEIKKTCGNDREKIRTLLKEEYGIETELLNTIKPGGVIFRGIFSRKADRRLQQAA